MPRLFVISDIHEHIEGMKKLLSQARFDRNADALVLLGDFVNAEPVVDWRVLDGVRELQKNGAIALAGNMELALQQRIRMAERAKSLAFLRKLPLYKEIGAYLFVHAGIRPNVPLEQQTPEDLTGIREEFWGKDAIPTDFSSDIVFGHTPTHLMGAEPGRLWHGHGKMGIDTGAKHGLRLTLVELTERIAYSVSTNPATLYADFRIELWGEKSRLSQPAFGIKAE